MDFLDMDLQEKDIIVVRGAKYIHIRRSVYILYLCLSICMSISRYIDVYILIYMIYMEYLLRRYPARVAAQSPLSKLILCYQCPIPQLPFAIIIRPRSPGSHPLGPLDSKREKLTSKTYASMLHRPQSSPVNQNHGLKGCPSNSSIGR